MVGCGWGDAEVTLVGGGPDATDGLFDVRKAGEWMEFAVESMETDDGFGVLFEPVVAFLAVVLQLSVASFEVADLVIEAVGFGSNDLVVNGLGVVFSAGPGGRLLAPVAPVSPTAGVLGELVRLPVSPADVDEMAGRLPFWSVEIAAMSGAQVGSVLAERDEATVHLHEFAARVRWDGGGDGFVFGLEAGVA
jgi:hypothetical protein